MRTVFGHAGLQAAGLDVRFFGETHDAENPQPHLFSWWIELDSEDGAADVLDWLEADGMKPCRESCSTQVDTFDVGSIPEARGVHRLATAAAVEAAGNPNEQPFESYFIGFTDGAIVYTLDLNGPPGSMSEDEAEEIATAFYDRLTDD